jgi:hypothetical protein
MYEAEIKNGDTSSSIWGKDVEALDMAIKSLEQQPITWIVGKNDCQVAVRNMPIDKMLKISAIIEEEEQRPCEDAISREDVLDLAKKGVLISNGSYESVCKAINELPPVMPKIQDWLESFNNNSATECFTAVQELREKIKTN